MRNLAFLFLLTLPAWGTPSFYRTLTVTSNTALLPSTQTNFPVLVSVTDNTLRVVGSGGNVQNASGFDITFWADINRSTALSWEMELYTGASGIVVAHVRIPSCAIGTVFYMYYGDATISTFQSTATAVWDSSFVAVHHLATLVTDSTANALTLTNNAVVTTVAAAKVNGGANFVAASSQYLSHATNAAYNTTDYTVQGWIRLTTTTGTGAQNLASHGVATNNPGHYSVYAKNADQKLALDIPFVKANVILGGTALSTATWYHVAATKSGNVYNLYLNGVTDAAPVTDATAPTVSGQFNVGAYKSSGGQFLNGDLDEVRISSIARTADWIKSSYNAQNDPTTFLTLGAENPTPPSLRMRPFII